MSDGVNLSGEIYKHIVKTVNPDEWRVSRDGKNIGAVLAYKNGELVGILMPVRVPGEVYNRETVEMSLRDRAKIRQKKIWEMSFAEATERYRINRNNPEYSQAQDRRTYDEAVEKAILSGKPVPEEVAIGEKYGTSPIAGAVATVIKKLSLAGSASPNVTTAIFDYLRIARQRGKAPGTIYSFVQKSLEAPPPTPPPPPSAPTAKPAETTPPPPKTETPLGRLKLVPKRDPKATSGRQWSAVDEEGNPREIPTFNPDLGGYVGRMGFPTRKAVQDALDAIEKKWQEKYGNTAPAKKVSPNDIDEISISEEGEVNLEYAGKKYQAVPLFGRKGFRIYDADSGVELGEVAGKADASEALAEMLSKPQPEAAPAPKEEPKSKIATKYIEPKTPQYREKDYLISLKLRSDRDPVIWINQKTQSWISLQLLIGGVYGFSPSAMGTNVFDVKLFSKQLDQAIAAIKKRPAYSNGVLEIFGDNVREAARYSRRGTLSVMNVDSPERSLLVNPAAYKALEPKIGKGSGPGKVGTLQDLIQTLRHENIHAETVGAIAKISQQDQSKLSSDPNFSKFRSILENKGYSGETILVVQELVAHVLSGDFDFFSKNGMTPEELVRAYALVRPYILAVDKDAVARAERFKMPGVKIIESEPVKLSGGTAQKTEADTNTLSGLMSTQPLPERSAKAESKSQESDFMEGVLNETEDRQDLINKVIESTSGKYSEKQQSLLEEIVEQQLSVPRKTEEMSTRIPTSKTITEDAGKDTLIIGLNSIAVSPKMLDTVIRKMTVATDKRKGKEGNKLYHGLSGLDLTEGEPIEASRQIIDRLVANLLWLHDKMPKDQRDRAKLWYDGANKLINDWSKEYKVGTDTVAGVIAVLSPQKDWYQNAEMARKMLESYKNRNSLKWNPKMDTFFASKEALEGDTEESEGEGANLLDAIVDKAERIKKSARNFRKAVQNIRGKDYSQLTSTYEKAVWMRGYDEATTDRSFRILLPEGTFGDIAVIESGKDKGKRMKMAWQSYSAIAKAIDIMENPSYDNISNKLGTKHKVRNFYNNMLFPNSENGHVTIDTHAVAAALLQPLSSSDMEVNDNFGGISSASTGSQGTYGLIAEAYRKAAAKRGLLAREMQSITWEAVRGLFEAKFKQKKVNKEAINDIWNKLAEGKESDINKIREEILEAAGGITKPTWVGQELRTAPPPKKKKK